MDRKPFDVACILAFNEERTIAGVVVKTLKFVDRVVVYDDGSGDLAGEIAEATAFYVSRLMIGSGGVYVWQG